jgi:hypothetical protein
VSPVGSNQRKFLGARCVTALAERQKTSTNDHPTAVWLRVEAKSDNGATVRQLPCGSWMCKYECGRELQIWVEK